MNRRTHTIYLLGAIYLIAMIAVVGLTASPPAKHSNAVPPAQIGLAPETSRTPEGAKGADVTLFWNSGRRSSLFGGAIHIDSYGLTLIENFEEIQKSVYCPYWDAYGSVWTRGFGETDWSGNFGGRCISHDQATNNLRVFIESKYMYAIRNLGVSLTQHQVDALASFVWNLGAGIFNGTTVGADLRSRQYYAASVAMLSYDRAGGQVLGGLVTRRHAEFRVFNTPDGPTESPAHRAHRIHAERVKQLHNAFIYRVHLKSYLATHRCRKATQPLPRPKPHTRLQKHQCWVVKHHGDQTNATIKRLRRELHV